MVDNRIELFHFLFLIVVGSLVAHFGPHLLIAIYFQRRELRLIGDVELLGRGCGDESAVVLLPSVFQDVVDLEAGVGGRLVLFFGGVLKYDLLLVPVTVGGVAFGHAGGAQFGQPHVLLLVGEVGHGPVFPLFVPF